MKTYSMRTRNDYEVFNEEDNLGEWIFIDDFETFKENLIKSINEYTDTKGLISSKFIKIAIDRCENAIK